MDDRLDRRVQHERMLFREQQLPLRAHVFGGILGRSRRRVVRSGDRLAEHACAIGLPLNARVAIDTGPQAFPGPRVTLLRLVFPVQVGISAWLHPLGFAGHPRSAHRFGVMPARDLAGIAVALCAQLSAECSPRNREAQPCPPADLPPGGISPVRDWSARAGVLYRHAEPLRSELACFASLRGL